MAAVKQKLKLKSKKTDRVHEVTFDHALNLLRLQASKGSTGWSLDEKDWIFENNEISRRTNTGSSKKSEEQ